ncbi:MAG: undecaprenyl-diphosphate phosphatase, partial [Lachnospiraceae bacterium]|nr:undecaprenyl-diphosphate phosphatase [Lachnospiraceae bacterium]
KYWQALVVGVAQAFAVLPGLSRSGATIATGLMTKVKKGSIAQFAFLMVIVPICGEALLGILKAVRHGGNELVETHIGLLPLVCGFLAAFISGLIACKWMIAILKKFNLYGFAVYTFIVGVLCIVLPYIFR